MSASLLSTLCALLPALDPDLAAHVLDDLLAAVPRLKTGDDPAKFGPALVRKFAAMHPRDLEEAMLAVQIIAAQNGAALCTQAGEALDPASKEASRLRRDAAMQQRVIATLLRALHRARARPMLADPQTGEVWASVAPAATAPAERRHPAGGSARGSARAEAAARKEAAARAEEEAASQPFPPPDVFDGHPDLKALNDRWYSLPRWEDMTMEERRQTWGYKPEPANATDLATGPGAFSHG